MFWEGFLKTTNPKSGKVYFYREKNGKFPECSTVHFTRTVLCDNGDLQIIIIIIMILFLLLLRVVVIICLILVFLCSRYFLMAIVT